MRIAAWMLILAALVLVLGMGCGKARAPISEPISGPMPQAQPPASPAAQPEPGGAQPTPGEKQADLAGLKVAIVIAPSGFRDEEFLEPNKALKDAGAEVTVVSLNKGECKGAVSATAEATATPDEINPDDYAAVVFVGGPGMYKHLDNKKFVDLAKRFGEKKDKVLAAICVSPAILANAGLLKGVKATAWSDVRPVLAAKGAEVIEDEPVVVSGRFITASGPEAASAYARAIVAALAAKKAEQK
ncbi:MAG: DJ-1/PfpI family protein [Armatimonadetes bacterium]|nr:DJ-1/PfpI family protein [Armatimonadota bacterium]